MEATARNLHPTESRRPLSSRLDLTRVSCSGSELAATSRSVRIQELNPMAKSSWSQPAGGVSHPGVRRDRQPSRRTSGPPSATIRSRRMRGRVDKKGQALPTDVGTGLWRGRPWGWRSIAIPIVLLLGCAALFVGSDVVVRHLFPALSIGWRHALMTMRAGVVTGVGCTLVYVLMRRQQQQLSRTAERLTGLLESYQSESGVIDRFENPHLAHCREVLDCHRRECPMYDSPGERCWQIIALNGGERGVGAPRVTLQQCHDCLVYRRSCPDRLTELGESFNNLMFLLEEEAQQVGRMRSQMVEREKMAAVGQIAAGIAHEVGNPLSSISSIVQMLKRAGDGAPTAERLDLIQTHIRRISMTVRQLVTLARPAAYRWEQIDLGPILEEAVRLIVFDRRARTVEIDFPSAHSLPLTYGMPDQLQQVFINLLLNALDSMPEGGKLTIRAQNRRRHIAVRIQDTGCGVAPEVGRRIFEPFFSTKPPGEGTGLGLAVSYGIVQKHGGDIDFVSTPGEGTAFTVLIPIVDRVPDDSDEPNHHTPR